MHLSVFNFNGRKSAEFEAEDIMEQAFFDTLAEASFWSSIGKSIKKKYRKSQNFRSKISMCTRKANELEEQDAADYVMDNFVNPLFEDFVKLNILGIHGMETRYIQRVQKVKQIDEHEALESFIDFFSILYTFTVFIEVENVTGKEFYLDSYIESLS